MIKKMLALFTTIVAALAVVAVAWADDGGSEPVRVRDTATSTSIDDSSSSTDATTAASLDASTDATTTASVDSSTSTNASASTSTSEDNGSTSTSTSLADTTSTSTGGSSTTSTTVDSTTSTSVDDNEVSIVADAITVYTIPGVGSVTIETFAGQLFLVSVTAPGWNVEHDKIESDRIELEFSNTLDAEAEFRARINNGEVEVRVEVDQD